MSKYSKMGKVAKCGSMDSKYFGDAEQFEKDVLEKVAATEDFKRKIKELILENPSLIEQRYNDVIKIMLEIRKEYIV